MAASSPAIVRRRWLSLLIVLGVVLLLGTAVGAKIALHPSRSPADSSTDQKWDTAWESLGYGDVEQRVSPLYPVQLGQVVKIQAQEDVSVKAGAPLLQVDDREARLRLEEAEIAVQAAEQELKQAQEETERHQKKIAAQDSAIRVAQADADAARFRHDQVRRRYDRGSEGSADDVRSAEAMLHKAEAAVEAEKAKRDVLLAVDPQRDVNRASLQVKLRRKQAQQAQIALDECTLKAPFDGTPLRILASVGQTLGSNPQEPAIQFCPNAPRIVRAELEQEFAPRVRPGQQVSIEDYATGALRWNGTIRRRADWYIQRRSVVPDPMKFNDVRTLECIVDLELAKDQPAPRIGQRVTIKYPRPEAR